MNKVILMGRLTRDPEIRYTTGERGSAVCRYTLAVNRSYKKEGEAEADFINIVSFGARGEFAGKYFKKGMMVAVVGELRISAYTDNDGSKRWNTGVVASEQYFAESKKADSAGRGNEAFSSDFAHPTMPTLPPQNGYGQQSFGYGDFEPIEGDEDLPF